jgi:hypothetical protein
MCLYCPQGSGKERKSLTLIQNLDCLPFALQQLLSELLLYQGQGARKEEEAYKMEIIGRNPCLNTLVKSPFDCFEKIELVCE